HQTEYNSSECRHHKHINLETCVTILTDLNLLALNPSHSAPSFSLFPSHLNARLRTFLT
ncbi:hypothetical protein J6590_103206, partial [Homalodisca vitripennis]